MVAIEPAPLEDGLYNKVGGWLVLPAIGTYLAPFTAAYAAYEFFSVFSYSAPAEAQILIVAYGLAYIGLTLAWLYTCVLLSRMDYSFPKCFIVVCIATLLLQVSGVFVAVRYSAKIEPEDVRDLVRTILFSLIWIPYMLYSKRVRATFYGIRLPAMVSAAKTSAVGPIAISDKSAIDPAGRWKRKGHRLGVLISIVGAILLFVGLANNTYPSPQWASFLVAIGSACVLFGYLIARLWFWFKAA